MKADGIRGGGGVAETWTFETHRKGKKAKRLKGEKGFIWFMRFIGMGLLEFRF